MYQAVLQLYRPRIRLPHLNEKLRKFFRLFFPGIIGSGVIQLNIIIGTIIASFLPVGAISHIYYADRLNQLPLAIFGIAMGVVLLPSLSKAIKENNTQEIETTQNRSLEFCLLISLPSAAGLFILSYPIINILFERGAFLSNDTFYTSQVLSIFALGLPAYILIKVLVTCFFAREDTKTPLYISIISVIINVVLSLETFSKFFCISFSVLLSSADVASSKKNIFGFFKIVLAIATLCFSPPDNFNTLSPTMVSKPSAKVEIK